MPPEELVPWRDVERWECVRCGKCCKTLDVSLSFEEEEVLKTVRPDSVVYGKIGAYVRRVDGKCVFYAEKSGKGMCTIYSLRPKACKLYPFYVRNSGPENARYGSFYVFLHRECEGIGVGRPIAEILPEVLNISPVPVPETSASRGLCSESPSRRSGRASCKFSAHALNRQSSSRSR